VSKIKEDGVYLEQQNLVTDLLSSKPNLCESYMARGSGFKEGQEIRNSSETNFILSV